MSRHAHLSGAVSLVLLMVALGTAGAQDNKAESKAETKPEQKQDQTAAWKTYVFADDQFSVELPAEPKVVTEKATGTVLSNRQYQLTLKDGGYVIGAARYSSEAGLHLWDASSMARLANAMKGECRLRDGKAIAFAEGLSYEAVLDTCKDGTVLKLRIYKAGDRMFQLIAAGPPDIDTRADTARFQDSFKLLKTAAAAAPPPQGKLIGAAAWNALVGNTISGKFDGELQIEHYLPDGRVKLKYDDEYKSGTWTLRNEKICITVKDEDEECWSVEVDGDKATFIEPNGKRLDYEILKGNARGL